MPKSVVIAQALIVLSALFPFLDSYYAVVKAFQFLELSYAIWVVDEFWLLVMCLIAWRVGKCKDWRLVLLGISLVPLSTVIPSVRLYDLSVTSICYFLEVSCLIVAWIILQFSTAKRWFEVPQNLET